MVRQYQLIGTPVPINQDKDEDYKRECDKTQDMYGELRRKMKNDDGTDIKDETALFDEYRQGIKTYTHSPAAGSYRMTVGRDTVEVEFYAGDSMEMSQKFVLRG